ncbi:hypothetical protein pb186bvf_012291 [Paramecium bursaria]
MKSQNHITPLIYEIKSGKILQKKLKQAFNIRLRGISFLHPKNFLNSQIKLISEQMSLTIQFQENFMKQIYQYLQKILKRPEGIDVRNIIDQNQMKSYIWKGMLNQATSKITQL